jgi:autotransporter-associated beta strand protein
MPGASPFVIGVIGDQGGCALTGPGVTNNSGVSQNFTIIATTEIFFRNSATAGTLTVYTNEGAAVNGHLGGKTEFFNTSTAGNATIWNDGGTQNAAAGGMTVFHDSSTAANATLIANGGTNGGDGGVIEFLDSTTGGTCRMVFNPSGEFNCFGHAPPGVTVGSIEGSGQVSLGANKLTVGTNNLTTTFSGMIFGIGGSLTKVGTGALTLGGANTYTGGTTVNAGTLLLQRNGNASNTGTGPVTVTAGSIGGDGIVAGDLTIGDGRGSRAAMAGDVVFDTPNLVVNMKLTFKSDGDCNWQINSSDLTFGTVTARGVTIDSHSQFLARDIGTGRFPQGTVLTIIKNTSQTPISGTFRHLPDGTRLTVGANTILINYHGGTSGRDMIGTVQ